MEMEWISGIVQCVFHGLVMIEAGNLKSFQFPSFVSHARTLLFVGLVLDVLALMWPHVLVRGVSHALLLYMTLLFAYRTYSIEPDTNNDCIRWGSVSINTSANVELRNGT
jgi:hypothetical protein